MRLLKPLIAIVTLLVFASAAHGAVIDINGNAPGHVQFPISEAAVSFRPTSPTQKSLTVTDYFIHDLVNQKGLDVRASRQANAPAWAYESITLKNLKISNIERREDLPGGDGLHIDHIRIAGGGNAQDVKTNILIENVVIDGGDALPILITDGIYGTVTLRNVQIKNTTLNNVQFKTDRVGSVDRIIIDNSPGIGVALIGRPGSVGEVLVRNSPDVRLGDSLNSTGRTGAIISYIDGVSAASGYEESLTIRPAIGGSQPFASNIPPPVDGASVPEPGALGLVGLAVAMLMRRR